MERFPILICSAKAVSRAFALPLLLGSLLAGCQTSQPTQSQPTRSPAPTVGAFGTLIPTGQLRNLAPVTYGVDGTVIIDQLFVDEGDYVRKGDILVQFRHRKDLLAERIHLQNIIAANKNRLIESHDVLRRFNQLSNLGAYPQASFQERAILYQSIANQLSEAQLRLDQNTNRLRNSVLVAPFSGVVTRIYSRSGEPSSQHGVLQIGNLDHLTAELEVYESDLRRIRIGQRVLIRSETGSFVGTLIGGVVQIVPGIRQRTTLPTTAQPTVDVRVGIVRVSINTQYVDKIRPYVGTKLIAKIETS